MALITGFITFVKNTKAAVNDINSNFAKILAVLTGGIDDANVDAIGEAKITFDGAGHGHGGGADGKVLDGSAMPAAVLNLAHGAVKFKSGVTGNIANGGFETVTYAVAFDEIPIVQVEQTTTRMNDYIYYPGETVFSGNNSVPGDPHTHSVTTNAGITNGGVRISLLAPGSFRITNFTGGASAFNWRAIGI